MLNFVSHRVNGSILKLEDVIGRLDVKEYREFMELLGKTGDGEIVIQDRITLNFYVASPAEFNDIQDVDFAVVALRPTGNNWVYRLHVCR